MVEGESAIHWDNNGELDKGSWETWLDFCLDFIMNECVILQVGHLPFISHLGHNLGRSHAQKGQQPAHLSEVLGKTILF